MDETQLLDNASAAPFVRGSSTPRVRPNHEARSTQISILRQLATEMDKYVDQHRTAANSMICDHWALFKSIMPEEVDDWFAQLETTASLKQRTGLESYESISATNVLETTEKAFCKLWESNDPILHHVGMVVFRRHMADPERSADMIEQILQAAYADAEAEVQDYYNRGGPALERMETVLQGLRERAHDPSLKTLRARPCRKSLQRCSLLSSSKRRIAPCLPYSVND
jgi:hypothetical protein